MPPALLNQSQQLEIRDKYVANVNLKIKDLAKEYGVQDGVISRILNKYNIQIRQMRTYCAFPVNQNFFEIIDTPVKAYWVGFLLADGCIAKSAGTRRALHFSLAQKDGYLVKQLAEDLEYKGRLFYSVKRCQWNLQFNCPKLCSDLISKGFLDWKDQSKGNPRILKNIPVHLWNNVMHGFFDGDGCISTYFKRDKPIKQYAITFVAHLNHGQNMAVLAQLIHAATSITPKIKIQKTCISCTFNGNKQVDMFGDWLYKNHVRKMYRKYARFLAVKSRDFLNYWADINNWEFKYDKEDWLDAIANGIITAADIDDITNRFTEVVRHGFVPIKYINDDGKKILARDLKRLIKLNIDTYIKPDGIYVNTTSSQYGNKIIYHHQPLIWTIKRGDKKKSKSFENLINCKSKCKKAITKMLADGRIYPERLIREIQKAGVAKASLLPAPPMMAAIKYFKLSGKWFDPCAGWGSRLLAAHALGLKYEGIEPADHFSGLLKLKDWLKNDAILVQKLYQGYQFPNDAQFVMTSPPFFDKENYGLNDKYKDFESWYKEFLKPLIVKCKSYRTVFHVDNMMCARIEQDYNLNKIKFKASGKRLHYKEEWFIEILQGKTNEIINIEENDKYVK